MNAGHPNLDTQRLRVAAHELGHFLAWQQADMQITDVWVRGHGPDATGRVELSGRGCRDATQAHAYLVGLLAGRAADKRWCAQHDLEHDPAHSRGDLREFRHQRRHPWVRDLSDADLAADADHLVRAEWRHIERLTPALARQGHL